MSEKNEWKLVPVVPTDEMVKAAFDQFEISAPGFATGNDARRAIYAAMLNAAPSAPGDAQDEPVPEWAACESRRPWVTNSLKANAQELRDKEKRCRRAFNKDFMGVPSRYVADAYAEAAAVFEAKLVALAAQVPQQGEA